jgi:hypothetical protein
MSPGVRMSRCAVRIAFAAVSAAASALLPNSRRALLASAPLRSPARVIRAR